MRNTNRWDRTPPEVISEFGVLRYVAMTYLKVSCTIRSIYGNEGRSLKSGKRSCPTTESISAWAFLCISGWRTMFNMKTTSVDQVCDWGVNICSDNTWVDSILYPVPQHILHLLHLWCRPSRIKSAHHLQPSRSLIPEVYRWKKAELFLLSRSRLDCFKNWRRGSWQLLSRLLQKELHGFVQ